MSKHSTQQVPPENPTPYEVYCLECDLHVRVATLAEAGKIYDGHDQCGHGPHEVQCFDHLSDKMIPRTVLIDENPWCSICDRPQSDCGCVENGGNY